MSAAYANTFAQSPDAENSLENQLKQSLRRVEPSAEFVGHLHEWLTTPNPTILERRQNAAFGLLLVALSLASGVFILWVLRQLRAA